MNVKYKKKQDFKKLQEDEVQECMKCRPEIEKSLAYTKHFQKTNVVEVQK